MPQSTIAIKRNFLTVRQAAEFLGIAERTVLYLVATNKLAAEHLDPERPRSDLIIATAEAERLKKEREKAWGLTNEQSLRRMRR